MNILVFLEISLGLVYVESYVDFLFIWIFRFFNALVIRVKMAILFIMTLYRWIIAMSEGGIF